MARVRIDLPELFPFSTALEVRVTDLNYGNHLANDALLALLHEARVRFLRAHGMHEGDVGGTVLIMNDAAVVYRAEAFAGDQLRIDVALVDPSRVGCDFVYRVSRPVDDKLVAEAKTGVVFLDPVSRRVVKLPTCLLSLMTPAGA